MSAKWLAWLPRSRNAQITAGLCAAIVVGLVGTILVEHGVSASESADDRAAVVSADGAPDAEPSHDSPEPTRADAGATPQDPKTAANRKTDPRPETTPQPKAAPRRAAAKPGRPTPTVPGATPTQPKRKRAKTATPSAGATEGAADGPARTLAKAETPADPPPVATDADVVPKAPTLPPAPPPVKSELPLELIATMEGDGSWASLYDPDRNRVLVVEQGDRVRPGVWVEEIAQGRVFLGREGARVQTYLQMKPPSNKPSPRPRPKRKKKRGKKKRGKKKRR